MSNDTVLSEEHTIGIETFFNPIPGIGGKLRKTPEGFSVEELFSERFPTGDGPFSIARITAVNWETHHLIDAISSQLHISQKRISFAGTKDKRARTTQFFSFYKVPEDRIRAIDLKDISIDEIITAPRPLRLGDLKGNRFDIMIHDILPRTNKKTLHGLFQTFLDAGGFPNFFGVQRFGVIRPITHEVGKHMVNGDFELAVMTYLVDIYEAEDVESREARSHLFNSHDFNQALQEFPRHLSFERSMIAHLVTHPDDYLGALNQLPNNLITMFVYAFQSYLFNRMLSRRIKENIPIHQAIIGDVILPVRSGSITQEYIPVNQDNIKKINQQLARHHAYVSGVLVGSNTVLSKGKMGKIEQDIIDEESIDQRNFIIPELMMASSYGTRRAFFAPLHHPVSYTHLTLPTN